jgi:hypothetical protein
VVGGQNLAGRVQLGSGVRQARGRVDAVAGVGEALLGEFKVESRQVGAGHGQLHTLSRHPHAVQERTCRRVPAHSRHRGSHRHRTDKARYPDPQTAQAETGAEPESTAEETAAAGGHSRQHRRPRQLS